MNPSEFAGWYDFDGLVIEVGVATEGLELRFPGVPDGFHPPLRPNEDGSFRVIGSWFDGMEIRFAPENGAVRATAGPFTAISGDPVPVPSGSGLLGPAVDADADYVDLYEALISGQVSKLSGDTSVPDFVEWLTGRGQVLFHGSGERSITEFKPVRSSVELANTGGRGNIGGVYATEYGLWAMFFAVIDRSRLKGSIRNGVGTFHSEDGRRIDVYNFSVHYEELPKRPFSPGSLYVLPRDTFRQMPLFPGGPPSNEWVSEVPVRPRFRLDVVPDDFPFLDQIGGHDDTELIRVVELGDRTFEHAASAEPLPDGFRVAFSGGDDTIRLASEWIELAAPVWPDIQRSVVSVDGDTVTLDLTGPDAYQHVMRKTLIEMGLLDD